jgi:acyl-CoA reductase-like NAD-dependent aldehyde dehydrogenase
LDHTRDYRRDVSPFKSQNSYNAMMGLAINAPITGPLQSSNPATSAVLGTVPDMDAAQVQHLVTRARTAQVAWRALPLAERCRQVSCFADVLLSRANEVIDLIVAESGKTRQEALGTEIIIVADLVRYFCKHAPHILAPTTIPLHLLKHRASYLHYVPRGVVGVIAPWNFPFSIPMGESLMALIAGNAVVMKPSEVTPLIALKAFELIQAAGLPDDIFAVATGRGATGAALIASGIDYCVFTGSVATGRKVAVACAERLIPCTLELGGKAPAIVRADADLDRTAQALVWGGFANSGQICASVERVYAHESIHDQLVDKMVALTKTLRQGDAAAAQVDVGAMSWFRQVGHVQKMVDVAIAEGATLKIGGTASEHHQFFAPTILTNVKQSMDIVHTEIFGPVIPVVRVTSDQQAIDYANDSTLGLLAYVFSRDATAAKRMAEQIDAGTVMINDVLATYACPETPWSGVKFSGIGRTHSQDGLRDLCSTRHINYDRVAVPREIWWYPYRQRTFDILLTGAKVLFGKRPWR